MADRTPSLLVRDWMRAHPIAVGPRDTVEHAREICERERVNQLPVLARGELVGIVTDRDLRDVFPSLEEEARDPERAHGDTVRMQVEDVMTSTLLTVTDADTIERAASLMREERIGSLPVLRDGRLVGIITRSDLLRALIAMAGHLSAR